MFVSRQSSTECSTCFDQGFLSWLTGSNAGRSGHLHKIIKGNACRKPNHLTLEKTSKAADKHEDAHLAILGSQSRFWTPKSGNKVMLFLKDERA